MARPPGLNVPKSKASDSFGTPPTPPSVRVGASPPPVVGRRPGRPPKPGVEDLGAPPAKAKKPNPFAGLGGKAAGTPPKKGRPY